MDSTRSKHIEITPGVCGGKPRIAGHHIKVQDIVIWHEYMGMSPDEIIYHHPTISLANVYAALTYYHDHREEIRQQIEVGEKLARSLQGNKPSLVQKILTGDNVNNLPSPLIKNLQLNNQQSKLSFLPLASPDQFLPTIDHWLDRGSVVLVVIFGAIIFLASILKYKVTVRADAQIRPIGELSLVHAAVEGKVNSIEVKENQNVKVGETIATISNSQLQTQKKQSEDSIQKTQQQLLQVDTQLGELARQIIAEQQTINRIIASAQANLNLSQREYSEQKIVTQTEVKEAAATAKLAREEWERYQQLESTGAVSRSQIGAKKAALEAALARLERAQASLNPSSANVTKATEQIAQEKARGEATIATLEREKESLKEKKITLQKQLKRDRQELQQIENNLKDSKILAPIAGTIQKLHLRNKRQLVSRGDLIAQISPSQVPLLVKASVTSRDIAKVETGQTVQLRVFACPYTDFGTLQGNIIAISPDIFQPIQEKNTTTSSSTDTNSVSGTYEVTIEPISHSLIKDRQECQLKSGMKAKAQIITKEETILIFILRKARLITQL